MLRRRNQSGCGAQRLLRGSLLLKLGLERLEFALLAAGAAGQMRKFFFDIFQVFRNRGSQKLHLLMLLRAAQNLILRFAELAADGSEFKFGLCSSRGSLRGLRLERFRPARGRAASRPIRPRPLCAR